MRLQTGRSDASQSAAALGTGTSPLTQASLSLGGVTAGRASLLPHCARFCVRCAFVCFLNAYPCLCLHLLQTQSQAMQNEVRMVAVHQRLLDVWSEIPSTNSFLCFFSQLFGRLPHLPHAVYMVLLENHWVQSNWAFRSCKNPLVTARLFSYFLIRAILLNSVFLSVVSLFCREQKRSCMSGRSAWTRSKKS